MEFRQHLLRSIVISLLVYHMRSRILPFAKEPLVRKLLRILTSKSRNITSHKKQISLLGWISIN